MPGLRLHILKDLLFVLDEVIAILVRFFGNCQHLGLLVHDTFEWRGKARINLHHNSHTMLRSMIYQYYRLRQHPARCCTKNPQKVKFGCPTGSQSNATRRHNTYNVLHLGESAG